MTKTMEINELISELIGFGGESTVKVWSNGADKAFTISHVGQGHTDGVLDTYVSIVVDDDRNLVDLSNVWHDASEEPTKKGYLLIQFGNAEYGTFRLRDIDVWCVWLMKNCYIIRWAYIDDLLPKQLDNCKQSKEV